MAIIRAAVDQPNQTLYLPMTFSGIPVLAHQGADKWMVDNSKLQAATQRLGYRVSKNLDDKLENSKLTGAYWGSIVEGCDEGDGWLAIKF